MVTEKITSYDEHNFLYPFCENLAKKCELAVLNENGLFKMKLGAYINSNTLNLMLMLIYPALDGKHSFWVNFV